MIVTRRISNVAGRISGKYYGEKKNRHFMSNTFFQKKKNRAIDEIITRNSAQQDKG